MQACKDHDAFRGLFELMPHFARVRKSTALGSRTTEIEALMFIRLLLLLPG